jgi:hypothetical protein
MTDTGRRGLAAIREAAGPPSSRHFLVLAMGMFTTAVTLGMLVITSAHEGIVFGPDAETRLLAFEMIAVALLLALVSAGDRIRLTLQMILIYLATYLILPGYHHSSANEYPFFGIYYAHDVRFAAAVMISVFMVALIAGYVLAEQTGIAGRKSKTLAREIVFPNQIMLVSLTVLSIVLMIAYLAHIGIAAAFSNRFEFGAAQGTDAEFGLFVTIPRIVSFISFSYIYTLYMNSKKSSISYYYFAMNITPFIITNFPFVLSRFELFGILLFFLVQTVDLKFARSRAILTAIFVFGALFAMPYVDSLTRYIDTESSTGFEDAYNSYISSGDFDGLQSMQNAVIYAEREGYENGKQLLSSVLFFVPRAVWSGKADATGTLTSRAAGYSFVNISQPLPSEFYVDFGLTGLGVASFLLGLAVARLDGWIDRNWQNGPRARLVAGVVVAYTIIVMRGSLLGIISTVVTFAAGVYLIIRLGLVRPEKLRIRRRPRAAGEVAPSPRVARHARTRARAG